jgi:sulfur-oxidizing protein SoxY
MHRTLSRRQAIKSGASAALIMAAAGTLPRAALAQENDYQALIAEFTGGAEAQTGRIMLDLPEIAENGNTVPMALSVESPMTEEDHVEEVLVLAQGNPNAGVATFHFTPLSGRAEANTRIRLARTQNVTAVARMSDGSYFTDTKEVKVTIGGCGG